MIAMLIMITAIIMWQLLSWPMMNCRVIQMAKGAQRTPRVLKCTCINEAMFLKHHWPGD